MHQPAITGSGVFTPVEVITNDELVAAFNAYADRWNAEHAAAIAAGEVEAKAHPPPIQSPQCASASEHKRHEVLGAKTASESSTARALKSRAAQSTLRRQHRTTSNVDTQRVASPP